MEILPIVNHSGVLLGILFLPLGQDKLFDMLKWQLITSASKVLILEVTGNYLE